MKSLMPWVCLAVTTGSSVLFAGNEGLDAYRDGSYVQAASYLMTNASHRDPVADYYMGRMRLYGYGVLKHDAMAMRYFQRAAEQGFLPAQQFMARVALNRDKDPVQALFWFKKAAALGDVEAQLYCAAAYRVGFGASKNEDTARRYVIDAAKNGNALAQYALAEIFLASKPMESKRLGLAWLMKAADKHYPAAMSRLADVYAEGKITPADVDGSNALLASTEVKAWRARISSVDKTAAVKPEVAAAHWLSDQEASTLQACGYGLTGILSVWQNQTAREENHYNPAPQMEEMSRMGLYKPHFEMLSPNAIPLTAYYDIWMNTHQARTTRLDAPRIALLVHDVTPRLVEKAILGDSTAQFELGQLYQQGVSVPKNIDEAVKYYAKAAAQQDLRAEYNLGLLYLEGETGKPDYQQAVGWFTDAAFKGYADAQYVLAQLKEQGYRDTTGNMVLQPDQEQAVSMYYLGSSNGHPASEYRLAMSLGHDSARPMPVVEQQKRAVLMTSLYQHAASKGVIEAVLPYAFFQAMSSDMAEQKKAFDVATKGAEAGDPLAMLLLGLLYDRGIGVDASHSVAMTWYKKMPSTPVSGFILGTYLAQDSSDNAAAQALLNQAASAGFSYAPFNLAMLEYQQQQPFLPTLIKAHELGNKTASVLLADYYLTQNSDAAQMNQARAMYQALADKGDLDGQLKLGYMLEQGLGGVKDIAQAATWYEQAANQGQAMAQYRLGRLNQLGLLGALPNEDAAKKWYTLSMNTFMPSAVSLGFMEETTADQYQQAKQHYELAANQGDAIAQFNLGLIYEEGKGVAVQFEKAAEYYQKAAQQGHVQAMVQLAGFYLSGNAGDHDEDKALEWYQKAAAKGDREALYQLGLLSETGVGLSLDYAKAIQYYQASAGKGDAKAMLALARMYQYGQGVAKNNEEAAMLYKDLANMGNAYASYQLAVLTKDGAFGEQNKHQALSLLQRAVDDGSNQAAYLLQRMKAETDSRVSFMEPVALRLNIPSEAPAQQQYLSVLSEWNQGNESRSRLLLGQLLKDHPHYAPAEEALNRWGKQEMWDQSKL